MTSAALILAILIVCAIIGAVIVAVVISVSKKQTSPAVSVGDGYESYFDGSALEWFGWQIVASLIITFSLGIAFPWAMCLLTRWEVEHTVINGRRLKFTGTGGQLFGKYILWAFLTVITCGIYSIWFGLGMEKWRVKHTVYADDANPAESVFTGTAGGWFVNYLVFGLISTVTLGIGTPWAAVRLMKWRARNTVIGNSPLVFNGTGGQLFVHCLIGSLLSGITCGIYSIFFAVRLLKWQYGNTDALCRTPAILKKSRAHEESAMADYAKIRLAANDTELAAIRSGFTGNENHEQLSELANNGNIYAKYALALAKMSETGVFEGESVALLKSASDALYHPAMLDYSQFVSDPDAKPALLEEAARRGSSKAAWEAKLLCEQKAKATADADIQAKIDAYTKTAYWFKVAIELEIPEAVSARAEYDALCEYIAILYCQTSNTTDSGSGAAVAIVLAIGGGLIALLIVFAALTGFLFNARVDKSPEVTNSLSNLDTAYIKSGKTQHATLNPDDLYRYDSDKYHTYDYDSYTFSHSSSDIDVRGYLSDPAYYDRETKTLFINFGISADSTVNGTCNFCAYLVSEDYLDENGYCKPISPAIYAGEKIISIPCDFIAEKNLSSTRIHVIVYNGKVGEIASSVAISTDGNTMTMTQMSNWTYDVCKQTVSISFDPIQSTDDELNNSPESSEPNQPDVNSTPDSTNTLSEMIVGRWTTAYLEGETLYVTTFVFNADGTLELYDSEYMNSADYPELFGSGDIGWQPAPMGFPATYGNYSCDDNGTTISLCYTHDDIESFSPMYLTGHVMEISGDSMLFQVTSEYGDGVPCKYIKNVGYYASPEELCAMLGVELY